MPCPSHTLYPITNLAQFSSESLVSWMSLVYIRSYDGHLFSCTGVLIAFPCIISAGSHGTIPTMVSVAVFGICCSTCMSLWVEASRWWLSITHNFHLSQCINESTFSCHAHRGILTLYISHRSPTLHSFVAYYYMGADRPSSGIQCWNPPFSSS
jgi:hypothetical protein